MKIAAKISFYLGIACLIAGACLVTFGILENNKIGTVTGIFLFVATIIAEIIAVRFSLIVDKKENPVETKEEARKPH